MSPDKVTAKTADILDDSITNEELWAKERLAPSENRALDAIDVFCDYKRYSAHKGWPVPAWGKEQKALLTKAIKATHSDSSKKRRQPKPYGKGSALDNEPATKLENHWLGLELAPGTPISLNSPQTSISQKLGEPDLNANFW